MNSGVKNFKLSQRRREIYYLLKQHLVFLSQLRYTIPKKKLQVLKKATRPELKVLRLVINAIFSKDCLFFSGITSLHIDRIKRDKASFKLLLDYYEFSSPSDIENLRNILLENPGIIDGLLNILIPK